MDLVPIVLIVLACSYALLSALWTWWRLRTHAGLIHRIAWDLEALAGVLRKHWGKDQ